jgi:hypothetical protein
VDEHARYSGDNGCIYSLLFPKNILLVQDDLSGGVERVLDFNVLLHSASAVSEG